ncbi:MAG: Flp pilus assembly complex ATPase component [Kiritimatiellaeota bacterium]|nr:Flp pilus assembly complex ATPase component [Kiritimatiellota bacterium]
MKPYKFAEKILKEALKVDASDIYWLPGKTSYGIRFRVGGVQKEIETIPKESGDQCVAHLKVLASLLTYRTNIAQDGVIRDSAKFADCEFRVASIPTMRGERITIRVIDGAETPLYLEDLKFNPETETAIKRMIAKPEGLTILTGPTGCGKTTTIYAMIRELLRNSQDPASIITIEDPIESEIDGVSQISVKSDDDAWSYKDALKAALRQDVKTLVIGELRDPSVVKVALDAALSGHRVITTYHAGDIPSVYARLLHQGFEPFLIAAAVTGIASQRLLKRKNSTERVPVAATLMPDDDWKDFISSNPGLREIRGKIRILPGADLPTEAAEMANNGLIEETEAALI